MVDLDDVLPEQVVLCHANISSAHHVYLRDSQFSCQQPLNAQHARKEYRSVMCKHPAGCSVSNFHF